MSIYEPSQDQVELATENTPTGYSLDGGLDMYDTAGNPTEYASQYYRSDEAERLGVTPAKTDGFLKEYTQGLQQGGAETLRGLARTFDMQDTVEGWDYWMEHNQQTQASPDAYTFSGSWAGHIVGQMTPHSATAMAAAAVASGTAIITGGSSLVLTPLLAAKGGQFAATFLMTYGDKVAEITRDTGGMMEPWKVRAAAMISAIGTAGIEAGVGIEGKLGATLARTAIYQSVRRKGGEEIMARVGRDLILQNIGGLSKAILKGGAQESLEEVAELAKDDLVRFNMTGKGMSNFDSYASSALSGLVGGLFFGTAMGGASTLFGAKVEPDVSLETLSREVDPSAVNDYFNKKYGEQSIEKQQEMEGHFASLAMIYIQGGMDERTAISVAEVQKRAAMNIAFQTGHDPQTLVDSQSLAFVMDDITDQEAAHIRSLSGQPDALMRYLSAIGMTEKMKTAALDIDTGTMMEELNERDRASNASVSIEVEVPSAETVDPTAPRKGRPMRVISSQGGAGASASIAGYAKPQVVVPKAVDQETGEATTTEEKIAPVVATVNSKGETVAIEVETTGTSIDNGAALSSEAQAEIEKLRVRLQGTTITTFEEKMKTEQRITYLEAGGDPSMPWDQTSPRGVSPAVLSSETDRGRALAGSLAAEAETQAIEEAVEIQRNGGLRGQYLIKHNLAVFFSTADAGTVLHEWMHHLATQNLLPQSVMAQFKLQYMGDKEKAFDVDGFELMSNDIEAYVLRGVLADGLDENTRAAMDHVRGVMAHARRNAEVAAKVEGLELRPEVATLFDDVLGPLPMGDPTIKPTADALDAGMKVGRAGVGALSSDSMSIRGRLVRTFGAEQKRKGEKGDAREAAREALGVDELKNATDEQVQELLDKRDKEFAESLGDGIADNPNIDAVLRAFLVAHNAKSISELSQADRTIFNNILRFDTTKKLKPEKLEETIDKLEEYLDTIPDSPQLRSRANGGTFSFQNLRIKAERLSKLYNANITDIGNYFELLDDSDTNGFWHNTFFKPLIQGWKDTARLNQQDTKLRDSLYKKYKADATGLGGTYKTADGTEWTMGEVFDYGTRSRNDQQSEAIEVSNQVTKAEQAEFLRVIKADPGLNGLMLALDDFYAAKYVQANVVFNRINGRDLPNVGKFYAPQNRENGLYGDNDLQNQFLPTQSDQRKASEAWSKSRAGAEGGKIIVGLPLQTAAGYSVSVNNYMAKTETLNLLDAVMKGRTEATVDGAGEVTEKGQRIIDLMAQKYGKEAGTHKTLVDFLERERFVNARVTPMAPSEVFWRDMRANWSMSVLGLRPTVALKQINSVLQGLADIPGGGRTLMHSTAISNEVISTVAKNFREGKRGPELLEGTELFELYKEFSPEMLERMGDQDMFDIENSNKGIQGIKVPGMKGKTIGEVSMVGIRFMDMLAVAIVWKTAYDEHLPKATAKWQNQGDSLQDADKKARRDAADQADRIVRNTQPNTGKHQGNAIQTGNEFVKGFFPFSAQTMKIAQQVQNGVLKPLALAAITKDQSFIKTAFTATNENNTSPATKILYAMMIPALTLGIIARRRPPKDKEELLTDMLVYSLSPIPGVGGWISGRILYGREDNLSPSFLSAVEAGLRGVSDLIEETLSEEGVVTGHTFDLLATFAVGTTGFPLFLEQMGHDMWDMIHTGQAKDFVMNDATKEGIIKFAKANAKLFQLESTE